ncbi:hypothetical protein L6164_029147 [Bauhinia variegata]|uniref:Uncharacterized protein n=1 Tax=Bauhinia variegata TaxID=167791 RepID=A0ACB9L8U5_BAUVA|nr:hypothetical protein L6164_029147 [Bauhinia variegata]
MTKCMLSRDVACNDTLPIIFKLPNLQDNNDAKRHPIVPFRIEFETVYRRCSRRTAVDDQSVNPSYPFCFISLLFLSLSLGISSLPSGPSNGVSVQSPASHSLGRDELRE